MTNKKNKIKGNLPKFNFYWIYGIVAVILISINLFNPVNTGIIKSNYSEFKSFIENKQVRKVEVINKKEARVYIYPEQLDQPPHKDKNIPEKSVFGGPNNGPHYVFNIPNNESFSNYLEDSQKEYAYSNKTLLYDYVEEDNFGKDILGWVIFFGIMIAVWSFIMRRVSGGSGGAGGQLFNIGKSKAQMFGQGKSTNVTFDNVAGLEEAKEEVKEIVDFLKNPKKYTALGAKIPKGALLVGPPGTGKTLIAKAVAGEAKVPFFSLSGSDFVEMFVGVGASRVRDLFKQAKEKSPCIIFIDEIDAIGRARGKNPNMGSNDERENTLNQLLTEMDGFGTNSGVIMLAATNRADVLDRALMRAGRFDRQIYVDMPDLNERKEIFEVHLKPLKLEKKLDKDFLARQTPGFSGADIANICNEAALIAARKKKTSVQKQDFLDAVDRIIGGLEKKNKIITKQEKKTIAYHEAGHATVSWMLEHANPLVKVTIVPRGRSLGAAWYLPEERSLTTTEQILDEMCAALGGRAAESIIFNKISTGALSDLEKVTKQAMAMVTIYGLDEKIGNVSYYDSQNQGYGFTKPYSEETAKIIDQEIKKIIDTQYERAKSILKKHEDKLHQLSNKLLETEVIFKEDLEDIFGKRPFQKEEIKTETKKEETANKTKKVIPKKTSSSKKTSNTSNKVNSKKSA
ncbi:MAG: peptidase M41 [Crocinitomicaceae bacterium]|nr:peptidase M41 [Crocinitomicaceae bacterium]MAW83288.1 peptidase M41 [Crocinitomicaceae bacterium]|tara:strand:+ start:4956 stop:7007 length:2052 start_codon:yes stop_codon:yes gene_type:complete